MNRSFGIDYEWLSSDHADAVERWTTAALVVNVGPWCATEIEDTLAKTVRPSVRLSALRLAEWFATNWWRLLWEPRAGTYSWRASHKVGNAGDGYVWPDLSFSSDWQWVHVSSRPTARWDAEPIRYLSHFDHLISIAEFVRGIDEFVNGTIARLSSAQDSASRLSLLWSEIVSERVDPEYSALRILEACMGYDPDEAPSDLLGSLRHEMDSFGTNAIQEMAAAYKQGAVPHLKDLVGSAQNYGVAVRVPKCDNIRTRLKAEPEHTNIPWRRAERAAQIARQMWGLTPPISTEDFCDLMQIPQASFLETQSRGWRSFLAGFRDTDSSGNFRITVNSKYGTSRRFDLARLVGDHITTGDEDRLLPGTRCLTSRQKFQRAFAQEFLCPFDSLKERVNVEAPNSEDIYDAARYFDVSPLMIHTTLVNKGVLGRETLDGWIE